MARVRVSTLIPTLDSFFITISLYSPSQTPPQPPKDYCAEKTLFQRTGQPPLQKQSRILPFNGFVFFKTSPVRLTAHRFHFKLTQPDVPRVRRPNFSPPFS